MSEFSIKNPHYHVDAHEIVEMVGKMADEIERLEEENTSLKKELEESNSAYEEIEDELNTVRNELEALQGAN